MNQARMLLAAALLTGAPATVLATGPALATTAAPGQPCAAEAAPAMKDTAPLCAVVGAVTRALERYQASLGSGPDALPPLAHAEFDFKTTTAKTAGAKISLFVFTLGGSHEKDVTDEITFLYDAPKPHAAALTPHARPAAPLEGELYETIRAAAGQARLAGQVGPARFSGLQVAIAFAVTRDANAGVEAPISLVTVGLNGDKSRNTTQTVTLTFSR